MKEFSKLSIVTYHYVRPIKDSKYPKIKGLELEGFKRQLDFFSKNYSIVSAEEVIAGSTNSCQLPPNSLWLTFDDGFKDHVDFVLPELRKRSLQGTFFPVVKPTVERALLDVHAIHYILESVDDDLLLNSLRDRCLERGIDNAQLEALWNRIDKSSPYDSESVIFFKRILQRELPLNIRSNIVRSLFKDFVSKTESEFCKELYMSEEDISKLLLEGMFVGSHTSKHLWLNSMDSQSQRIEIKQSLDFLSKVGANIKDWIMCYPYGAYNSDTLKILQELDCRIGVTTQVGEVKVGVDNPLLYPRFDTNEFPQ
jgi:peptidoglycan/xylan/chitin deacetylase (PgdA/CDA1 family)